MSQSPKKPNVRLYALCAVIIAVVFGVYRVVVMLVDTAKIPPFWFHFMMWSYMIIGCAIFLAVVILQRGFSNTPISNADLPDDMPLEERRRVIDDDKKRKRIAKHLLIPLVAIIIVFMYEILEIYYFPSIEKWFSSF